MYPLQYVAISGTNSSTMPITCGVPQGSVLGPLLFILYINDLPNSLESSTPILFADDTTVFYSSDNIDDISSIFESDLKLLLDWFVANKLSLNVAKTQFMVFSDKNINALNNSSISLANAVIPQVKTAKFLGIHMDKTLEWDRHIEYVCKKVSSGSYALNSSKQYLMRRNLKTLYYSLVHSHLSYGVFLWGNALKKHLSKLEIQQKRAIRNVCNVKYNSPCSALFKSLKVPKLCDLYRINLLKFMYKSIKSNRMSTFSQRNIDIHDHNTRRRNDPHIVRRASKRASRSFVHEGPRLWSEISSLLKDSQTIITFGK